MEAVCGSAAAGRWRARARGGAGTGYYSLPIAASLENGTLDVLDVLDVRPEFAEHVRRRAQAARIDNNIRATVGDGSTLPYEDDSFDAAFLVTVLGEIPDQDAALRELRRVLRAGGHLIVAESLASGDPHHVWFHTPRARAEAAGFDLEARDGGALAYWGDVPRANALTAGPWLPRV